VIWSVGTNVWQERIIMPLEPNEIVVTNKDRGGQVFVFITEGDDAVTWLDKLATPNAVSIHSVKQMVALILSRSGKKFPNQIKFLYISGHGAFGGCWIGEDCLDAKTFHLHMNDLVKLRPYFAKDASVLLKHCEIGKGAGRELLRALARLFGNGVTVTGGTLNQWAAIPWIRGDIVTCSRNRCKSKRGGFWSMYRD
jgi:hypothetical protein